MSGSRDEILKTPKHPYTQALLAAVPEMDKNKRRTVSPLEGEPPSVANPPSGCHLPTLSASHAYLSTTLPTTNRTFHKSSCAMFYILIEWSRE
ncbi:MAG: hypothetical protein Q9N32_05580 [Gammaproteobacteria bacterium]|nr:hypothetical protein [Gammaproteobacteria bacterium]